MVNLVIVMYASAVRDAMQSKDLEKMKAVAAQARQTILEHRDLAASYIELVDAIEALERGK